MSYMGYDIFAERTEESETEHIASRNQTSTVHHGEGRIENENTEGEDDKDGGGYREERKN